MTDYELIQELVRACELSLTKFKKLGQDGRAWLGEDYEICNVLRAAIKNAKGL